MAVNVVGSSQGSQILNTHPKRKKLGQPSDSKVKTKKKKTKEFLVLSDKGNSGSRNFDKQRFHRLSGISLEERDAFLCELIEMKGHQIQDISEEDIELALKSSVAFKQLPYTTIDSKGSPVVIVNLTGRQEKTIITVEETLQYLQQI